MKQSFTVYGCPVPWQRTGYNRKNRTFYTKSDTRRYQLKVRAAAALARIQVMGPPITMVMNIFFPDNRVRDDDNVEKTIRDALQGNKRLGWRPLAYVNDHHIRAVGRVVDFDKRMPRVEVELEGELAEVITPPKAVRGKRKPARIDGARP